MVTIFAPYLNADHSFWWLTRQPGLRGHRLPHYFFLLLVFASSAGKNEQQNKCSWRASLSKPPCKLGGEVQEGPQAPPNLPAQPLC
jgi:hypothetical protein